MHCYKFLISYDGTSYSGWQIQLNHSSIQEHIQNALRKILQNPTISIIGSGRTDAGVHAIGQVAHCKLECPIDPQKLLWSLNGLLPPDIRIKNLKEAPPTFHAQHDAVTKEYHYRLCINRTANPFQRLYSWHIPRKLDISLMKQGASLFIGTHDFTSFTNQVYAGSAAKNPIRHLSRLDVVSSAEEIRLEFEGNGFLYKMVRNIVGTLIEVGSGKINLSDIPTIFAAKDRSKASAAAPPHGLCLIKVTYTDIEVKEG